MPAESAYLSVLRTATAGLAARLDFTLDEIEDLRIAIDEACAMLLAQAIPGTDLECVFELGADQVTITVSVTAAQARMPAATRSRGRCCPRSPEPWTPGSGPTTGCRSSSPSAGAERGQGEQRIRGPGD